MYLAYSLGNMIAKIGCFPTVAVAPAFRDFIGRVIFLEAKEKEALK